MAHCMDDLEREEFLLNEPEADDEITSGEGLDEEEEELDETTDEEL